MTLKQTIATLCLVAFCGLGFSALAQGDDASPLAIESFPKTLDKNCCDGLARIYDECGDQSAILNAAVAAARAQNKSVLVVFGSEWCIWCHVFDSYIHGQRGMHDYKWRAEQDGELVHWPMQEMMDEDIRKDAVALNRYVAEHFVVAHIEAGADNGRQALEQIPARSTQSPPYCALTRKAVTPGAFRLAILLRDCKCAKVVARNTVVITAPYCLRSYRNWWQRKPSRNSAEGRGTRFW